MEYASQLDALEIEAVPPLNRTSLFTGLSVTTLIVFVTLAYGLGLSTLLDIGI
ncbi:MAG: hypothetical protein R8K48_01065 [Gallionella sp.]